MNIDIDIIERIVTDEASDSEKELFEEWLNEDSSHHELYQRVKDYLSVEVASEEVSSEEVNNLWIKFAKKAQFRKQRKFSTILSAGAAGAAALIIVTLLILPMRKKTVENVVAQEVKPLVIHSEPIVDGGVILLTTEGGEKYEIEAEIEKKEPIHTTKFDASAGNIAYNEVKPKEIEYHTLSVPKGKEFKVTLSDGTVVHLNANSKLSYPSSFASDKERRVKLMGEAYFEVTHNKELQFVVETEDVDVRVYGTKFNVNTHKHNVTETVLVEGMVTVQCETSLEYELKPNQMARYNSDNGKIEVKDVDVMNYVSWCSGIYSFYEETLENIMISVSLWYEVDIEFTDERVAQMKFICNLPRYNSIEQIMDILLLSGNISYKLVDNKVIISAQNK